MLHADTMNRGSDAGDDRTHQALQVCEDVAAPLPAHWRTENADRLTDTHVRARIVGRAGAPVVVVLGGISATRFVADAPDHQGWWSGVVGEGGGVDLNRFRVLGMDYAPVSGDSPVTITPTDHARLLALVLEAAEIDIIHTFIGASYGGMTALAFARLSPERVGHLVVLGAAHQPSALGTAWRGVQRRIIALAQDCGREADGVALARELAMTTYRSADEFTERFGSGIVDLDAETRSLSGSNACAYLRNRGGAYKGAMPAWRYLSLSRAIDLHRENPSAITTPTHLIAFDRDQIAPVSDIQTLADGLAGPHRLDVVSAVTGHDAFLTETETICTLLADTLGRNSAHVS